MATLMVDSLFCRQIAALIGQKERTKEQLLSLIVAFFDINQKTNHNVDIVAFWIKISKWSPYLPILVCEQPAQITIEAMVTRVVHILSWFPIIVYKQF